MGSSEIIEEEEDHSNLTINSKRTTIQRRSDKDLERPVLKLGYQGSLEDDINQLFESISIRTSAMLPSYQSSTSRPSRNTSPLHRNALNHVPSRSPNAAPAEPANLKQALRDLCISKASETAAKRGPRTAGSPRGSEVGRLKNIYGSVLVESGTGSSELPNEERKSVLVEIIDNDKTDFSEIENGNKNVSGNKTVVGLRSVRRVRLLYANTPSSTIVNGRRIPKLTRTVPRATKPVPRNKGSVKKVKQEHMCNGGNVYEEVDGFYDPITKELLCHRCHYALKNASKEEASKDSFSASNNLDPIVKISCVDEESKKFLDEKLHVVKNPDIGININGVKASEELSLPLSSDKGVDQKDSIFTSDQSVEIGSFSEKSVVTSPDSPPKSPELHETAIEEGNGALEMITKYDSLSNSKEDVIGKEAMVDVSRESFGNRPHMSKDVKWEAIQHIRAQNGSLGLRHFSLLKKLGCGDIGTVYLAELNGTNCLFAIKVMDNEFLEKRSKTSQAKTEREILKTLDHPFLPTLYSHFTSDNLSCLVMECCPGGDLHVLRQKQPAMCFPEPAARFYVAEVLLALEYLHMLGVIYRDLKPENVLVREDGHIMVTDFDLSLRCRVSPTMISCNNSSSNRIDPIRASCFRPRLSTRAQKGKQRTKKTKKSEIVARLRSLPQLVAEPTDARSNSFVGTHEYLSPEIINGEGHGAAVDWWTFGIFLYELLYGRTPFKGSTNEETLTNVVLQNLKFPDSPSLSFQAKDLIRNLLVKEPENRLGTDKGASEIKRHPFFQGLNWALIRCAIPPELPDSFDYGVSGDEGKNDYLECKAVGEHLEFELF